MVYLLGDFNIDILKQDVHNISDLFINTLYSLNFVPLILAPTHVTSSNASLIDNIFTNNLIDHSSGIICSDFLDHYPIFTSISNSVLVNDNNNNNPVFRHNFSLNNIHNLNEYFHSYNWSKMYDDSLSFDDRFEMFVNTYQDAIKIFCPLTVQKPPRSKQP